MKTRMLIHSFTIEQVRQRRHFQINLPRDAYRITGIAHSIVLESDGATAIPDSKDGLFFRPTISAGDIRLQAFERAGWFYAAEVTTEDRNLFWGDPSLVLKYVAHVSTHSLNNFSPVDVLVDGKTTVIHGHYLDRWSDQIGELITYKVNLYIEVELKNTCEA
ncbi:MAG: hypothetical protein ACOZCO_10595 [Bacteroidota bacterium]